LAVAVGRSLGALSRAAGRGTGSVIGGHAILAIQPQALALLATGRRVALVSGTNGKTTTTKLLAAAVGALTGSEVVTNVLGANMPTGLAAALAAGPPGCPAVLEVDEAWLGRVATQVRPVVVVLLNLSRDQLDRNNEVRHVAQRWRQVCQEATGATVVANADDPLVAWAASGAEKVTWVGAGLRWTGDATGCPQCAGPIEFAPSGDEWRCAQCDFARPQPEVWLSAQGLAGDGTGAEGVGGRAHFADGRSVAVRLRLPGRCNQANAVTAMAAATAMAGPRPATPEVAPTARAEVALAAMAKVVDVAGRYAVVRLGASPARLLLAKNPAGWAEVFDMLAPAPAPVVVAINARTADGHDPSWLWDVPFERLAGRKVVATGERGTDLAVRLHYADVDHELVSDLMGAVKAASGGRPGSDAKTGEVVDVVANYTSFHQLLARAGAGEREP
jgi:UDP-N-acetylmuramyl tripeptide synthase